jgi:REP element-mobilizing transposase RayT
LERRPLFFKGAAAKVSGFLSQYATEKGIYLKINYVNPDHVHALVDLPTRLSIEDAMQLLKGGLPIGLTRAVCCQASLGGDGDMAHSQGLSRALRRWPNTLPNKRSTIERRALVKSLSCWWRDTNFSGRRVVLLIELAVSFFKNPA